jgi:hypothetical protein
VTAIVQIAIGEFDILAPKLPMTDGPVQEPARGLSPLARYYGTFAVCIAGFIALFFLTGAFTRQPVLKVDVRIFMTLFLGLWLLFAYNTLGVGCPKCGKRLGLMSNGFSHGLPWRYCTRCGADLRVRPTRRPP